MLQKQELSMEKRIELIQRYINGEIGKRKAALEAGVGKTTMADWIARYESEGADGFHPRQTNRVYSPELKLAAVREYLSGNGSYLQISKKYKIRSATQLKTWVKVYNAHGGFCSVTHSEGGSYMKQGRETTYEERVQIVKECIESGKNYGAMALKHRVSYQQVRTWTLRFEEMGEAGLEDRRGKRKKDQTPRTELEKAQIEINQLQHKLYLAEMENYLLKKVKELERRDASHK